MNYLNRIYCLIARTLIRVTKRSFLVFNTLILGLNS